MTSGAHSNRKTIAIMDFTLQKHHEFDLSSDSEHRIKRPLKEINDPERLKRVVRHIEDTEEQMINLDDEGVLSTSDSRDSNVSICSRI